MKIRTGTVEATPGVPVRLSSEAWPDGVTLFARVRCPTPDFTPEPKYIDFRAIETGAQSPRAIIGRGALRYQFTPDSAGQVLTAKTAGGLVELVCLLSASISKPVTVEWTAVEASRTETAVNAPNFGAVAATGEISPRYDRWGRALGASSPPDAWSSLFYNGFVASATFISLVGAPQATDVSWSRVFGSASSAGYFALTDLDFTVDSATTLEICSLLNGSIQVPRYTMRVASGQYVQRQFATPILLPVGSPTTTFGFRVNSLSNITINVSGYVLLETVDDALFIA